MSNTLVVVSLVLQALTFAALTFFLFQLFRAQGRLLLRLDSLERGPSGNADLVNISTESAAPSGHKVEAPAKPATRGGPSGLKVGTVIEDFQLPDLDGKRVSLSDFRGKKVLLLYWSPSCGFCDIAAEELAPLQEALKKSNIQPVLVALGDAEANRNLMEEHRIQWPVLLVKDSPAEKVIADSIFQYCGTPAAYLLDDRRKVETRLVVGSDAIIRLAREAIDTGYPHPSKMRPLSESRIERKGIKAGMPAPAFALPDINGKNGETIALDQFRGRRVLLVFSDPQCGPCDELAPDLVKLHSKHRNNGMAFVMVGRGELEDNRKKALQHKIEFPVVLQDRWKLSMQYGIFATPVAFLIGKDGVVLRDVATGPDQILTLAHEGLAST